VSGEGTLVVLTTVASAEEGTRIARTLVDERLAACVNLVNGVRSFFFWEGRLQEEDEVLLLVKTRRERYGELESRLRSLHSYTVPEILALPVEAGSPAYVAWVRESVHFEGR
jgi:periplasmic divalent cation tolerance protein